MRKSECQGYASILKISRLLNSDTRRKMLYDGQKRRNGLLEKWKVQHSPHEYQPDNILIDSLEYAYFDENTVRDCQWRVVLCHAVLYRTVRACVPVCLCVCVPVGDRFA